MNALNSKSRTPVAAIVFLLGASSLSLARAAPAAPTSATTAATAPAPDACLSDARCKESYEIARRQSEAGQFEAALINYQNAYARKPAPWLLFSIGRVYQKLGRLQLAIDNYQRYINLPSTEADEGQLGTAKNYIRESQEQLDKQAEPPPRPLQVEPNPPVVAPAGTPTPSTTVVAGGNGTTQPQGGSAPAKPRRRPVWRLALGGTAIGAGLVVMGFGASALAVNNQIIDMNSATPGRTYDTAAVGGGLFGAGAAVTLGGILCIALP